MSLKSAKIAGFFSLPSQSIAEHNPSAYAMAMREAPPNSGSCSHCGTGIRHHVVIEDETGNRRFIGLDCAQKIGAGSDPRQIAYRMTDEQFNEWQSRRQAIQDERAARIAENERELQRMQDIRWQLIGDIVSLLRSLGGEFYNSLADQLRVRPLSDRQAHCVAKATSETGRRNKKNADSWDDLIWRCTADTIELIEEHA